MKKLLIPLALALVGLGGGLFTGHAMKPAPDLEEGEAAKAPEPDPDPDLTTQFVKLDRQFVVPVILNDKVSSLMVLTLAVEMASGGSEPVFDREPKLRDEFLRVLFTHAQSGGFAGAFTDPAAMDDLRASLVATARRVLGGDVRSVLLTSIVRQDL